MAQLSGDGFHDNVLVESGVAIQLNLLWHDAFQRFAFLYLVDDFRRGFLAHPVVECRLVDVRRADAEVSVHFHVSIQAHLVVLEGEVLARLDAGQRDVKRHLGLSVDDVDAVVARIGERDGAALDAPLLVVECALAKFGVIGDGESQVVQVDALQPRREPRDGHLYAHRCIVYADVGQAHEVRIDVAGFGCFDAIGHVVLGLECVVELLVGNFHRCDSGDDQRDAPHSGLVAVSLHAFGCRNAGNVQLDVPVNAVDVRLLDLNLVNMYVLDAGASLLLHAEDGVARHKVLHILHHIALLQIHEVFQVDAARAARRQSQNGIGAERHVNVVQIITLVHTAHQSHTAQYKNGRRQMFDKVSHNVVS